LHTLNECREGNIELGCKFNKCRTEERSNG
jgi:hypothetical protein